MEINETKRLINNFLIKVSIVCETKIKYLNLKTNYDKKYNIVVGIDSEMHYRIKRLESLGLYAYCDAYVKELFNKSNQLCKELNNLKKEMNFANSEYQSSNKLLNRFCNSLNKTSLMDIINYFDINIDLETKSRRENIDFIIRFVSEDLERIYSYFPNFSYEAYKGTITLVEIILGLKKKCEEDIKNYRDIEKRLIELELTERIHTNSHSKLQEELRIFELSMYNRIFRKKLIESLDKNKYDKYVEITKCRDEKYKLLEKYEKSKELKNTSYERYKNISILIPTLINKLGEKSLNQLIKYLNITISKTDDNYFNEKEEMRIALKKWFNYENKKLEMQFNAEDRVVIDKGEEKSPKKY